MSKSYVPAFGLEVAWLLVYLRSMSALVAERSAVAVWKRAIQPDDGTLRPAEARALLRLKVAEADLDRADALAAKARSGQLTAEEDRELENYLTIGSVLEFLKSKARRSLHKRRTAA